MGLCLSMTNYSLIPQEMMACGMPCVDLRGGSSEAVFGADGPVELAEPDPHRGRRRDRGPARRPRALAAALGGGRRAFVADASWETAAAQVEAGLREALRRREPASAGHA